VALHLAQVIELAFASTPDAARQGRPEAPLVRRGRAAERRAGLKAGALVAGAAGAAGAAWWWARAERPSRASR